MHFENNLNNYSQPSISTAQSILENAVAEDRPVVAILGQETGFPKRGTDRVRNSALAKLGIDGEKWADLLSSGPLDDAFYAWLNERFERRCPPRELLTIADVHFSAIYTSSFDPVLRKLFATEGRQPETVLVGDPPPPISRSKLRPKLYYLCGMTGAGLFEPPRSRLELNARKAKHAIPMLNTVLETSTPLGIVVIDGFRGTKDWLRIGEVLAVLGLAPAESVLWFGEEPEGSDDDREMFFELMERGVIVRDDRPFGIVYAEVAAGGISPKLHSWNEPGIVSFSDGCQLITNPTMRLSTEASASIVDDNWTDLLSPLRGHQLTESFAVFHSVPANNRLLFEGVRRGYAIQRNFERDLISAVERAIRNHANEKGAIILSGQSGIGKSIALLRLAWRVRESKSAAVLLSRDRIPSPVELVSFLSEVDKHGQVTLLIVDALEQPRRYDMLLDSFRSRGHRIVVVGSSYGYEVSDRRHEGRAIFAGAELSVDERQELAVLAKRHFPELVISDQTLKSGHALAQFFWLLPHSRARLGVGLGREARFTERELRLRGRKGRVATEIGSLGLALLDVGYKRKEVSIISRETGVEEENQPASKLIDYVMVCSRLYRWVPVNLVLRAVVSKELVSNTGVSLELIRDLFEGHDLFRWRYDDYREDDLLVGARLQIEAELICNTRLGGPPFEVERILDLILNATRAGPEGSEETRFVADIVFAMGPDGPIAERYRASYYEIASTLTSLRKNRGVRNARLMLQEATLRRHYIRKNESSIDDDERVRILDEAREAVDEALVDIASPEETGLRAARRTKDHLWVERAATYGFLATSTARRGGPPESVWSSYVAAREAVRNATGKVDTYFPLDISLWLPLEILEHRDDLGVEQTSELRADFVAAIDIVSDEALDSTQLELFQKQKLRAGELLDVPELSADAFKTLDDVGSTVGYFFRARRMSPKRSPAAKVLDTTELRQAEDATQYLIANRDRISADPRCMRLLLNCFWVWKTKTWLFEGLRQPLPSSDSDRRSAMEILIDLSSASGDDFQPRFRYLRAVITWLIGSENQALSEFRRLARDTEYVERKRVLPRHVIADSNGTAIVYSGVVQRKVGEQRWSVRVRELGRNVDVISGRWNQDIEIGQELKDFWIAFNYIGPIAYRASRR